MSILIQEYIDVMDYSYQLWNYSDSFIVEIKKGRIDLESERNSTPLKVKYNKNTL